jgi:hypothetical protein
MVEDVMRRLPVMKDAIDLYAGPDRVTAKQQQEELQRVANILPASAPTSVKKFTDRVLLSLQVISYKITSTKGPIFLKYNPKFISPASKKIT